MIKTNIEFKNTDNSDEKSVVFIDVDGSMYQDFHIDDNEIINDIFSNNKMVKMVDNILWKINSMDIISNSMEILKLRFHIYSILSREKYSNVYIRYKEEYIKHLANALEKLNIEKMRKLYEKYRVIILTNNEFSISLLSKKFDQVIFAKDYNDRFRSIKQMSHAHKVEFVIGNNYEDDIKSAKKVNAKSIYIGKSVLSKKFEADYICSSFEEALDIVTV